MPLPTSVEGVTGEANIANFFGEPTINMFLTPLMKGAERPTMQFVMMRISRFFMMNYLPLLIIWTSISHVALMESMQSILNLVPIC